jgi:hypothetical protein
MLQLLALAAAAGRVPLYARFPEPAERLAAVEMASVQIAGAAMLFPDLLCGLLPLILAVAISTPMLVLAGILSGESNDQILAASLLVAGWLTILWAWRKILRTPYRQGVGIGIASLWSIGGPVLVYLQADFGSQAHSIPLVLAGPIMVAVDLLNSPKYGAPEIMLSGLLLLSLIAAAVVRPREPKSSDSLSTGC